MMTKLKVRLQRLPKEEGYDSRWLWVSPQGERYFIERADRSNDLARNEEGTFHWLWEIRLEEKDGYLVLDAFRNLREAREWLADSSK